MTTTRLAENLWRIDLPNDRVGYGHALMQRETYTDSTNLLRPHLKVIVVDLARFIKLWELDEGYVLPPASEWDAQELARRTEFMRPYPPHDPRGTGAVHMPRAGLHYRIEQELRPAWKFWQPIRGHKVFYASIGDGRHRTRFVEYGGATDMPIEVDPESVNFYMDTCGLSVER